MAALEEFSRQIEARIAQARREPKWEPSESARFMAELEPRRRHFEEIAPRLVREIIRPRVDILASHFPNAGPERTKREERCAYWFIYCKRFPADTKLEFSIEHDEGIKDLIVHYQVYITPVFLKYDADEKFIWPLDKIDEQAIARWVEAQLLAFLDTYLRLDRGQDDLGDEVVFDPVCGMRISRSSAAATTEYRGHAYYFCSEDCRGRFSANPMDYVRFETA